jgi:hypothetical protein
LDTNEIEATRDFIGKFVGRPVPESLVRRALVEYKSSNFRERIDEDSGLDQD